jgi:hypothetical protein
VHEWYVFVQSLLRGRIPRPNQPIARGGINAQLISPYARVHSSNVAMQSVSARLRRDSADMHGLSHMRTISPCGGGKFLHTPSFLVTNSSFLHVQPCDVAARDGEGSPH